MDVADFRPISAVRGWGFDSRPESTIGIRRQESRRKVEDQGARELQQAILQLTQTIPDKAIQQVRAPRLGAWEQDSAPRRLCTSVCLLFLGGTDHLVSFAQLQGAKRPFLRERQQSPQQRVVVEPRQLKDGFPEDAVTVQRYIIQNSIRPPRLTSSYVYMSPHDSSPQQQEEAHVGEQTVLFSHFSEHRPPSRIPVTALKRRQRYNSRAVSPSQPKLACGGHCVSTSRFRASPSGAGYHLMPAGLCGKQVSSSGMMNSHPAQAQVSHSANHPGALSLSAQPLEGGQQQQGRLQTAPAAAQTAQKLWNKSPSALILSHGTDDGRVLLADGPRIGLGPPMSESLRLRVEALARQRQTRVSKRGAECAKQPARHMEAAPGRQLHGSGPQDDEVRLWGQPRPHTSHGDYRTSPAARSPAAGRGMPVVAQRSNERAAVRPALSSLCVGCGKNRAAQLQVMKWFQETSGREEIFESDAECPLEVRPKVELGLFGLVGSESGRTDPRLSRKVQQLKTAMGGSCRASRC